MEKVVLAYSGGLDTSICVKWLQEKYKSEVITVTVDVGQGKDLNVIAERAKKLGAVKHYSIDAKEEFVKNYVFPAIKANALYEGKYPINSALSRPLISSKMVEIAKKEKATAVAHGCTGKGNDQVRFDVTIKALAPNLKIIAPIREENMARDKEIEQAKNWGITSLIDEKSQYSIDQNLWGRSIECGPLDDPSQEPPEEIFKWTTPIDKTPDKPEYLTIEFAGGVPTKINGEALDSPHILEELNKTAGKHGVGRVDHVEDRVTGIKSREVYECPAATVILEAHKDLEKTVLTRHENLFKQQIDAQWTFLAYTGLWMDPLREDLEGFINKTQERVQGKVRVKLYKGGVRVVGRSSPFSLYDARLATYNVGTTFDQTASKGFIELWGLQTVLARNVQQKGEGGKKVEG
jgi:argininosuccinate synthase